MPVSAKREVVIGDIGGGAIDKLHNQPIGDLPEANKKVAPNCLPTNSFSRNKLLRFRAFTLDGMIPVVVASTDLRAQAGDGLLCAAAGGIIAPT